MPIRLRLALWHSGIFAGVLGLFGLALYMLMSTHLAAMVEETVASHADHLVAAVNAADHHGGGLVVPPLDSFEAPELYVQIMNASGAVLARSSNLGNEYLPVPANGMWDGSFPASLREKTLLSVMRPVPEQDIWVQVAGSYRERDQILSWLRWTLAGGGSAAILLVGILSAALAGRALRPVADMTETARAIALSRGFSRRLDIQSPNDELGQLAQTFNEMLGSLEDAYSAQQRFTTDASHELRAPLTAIRGNLDLLDRIRDMPEEERREMVQRVRYEAERLSRLVNDMLILARADAGQELDLRSVELDPLVVEVHRQAQCLANEVTVKLEHLEPVVVHGDQDSLKQLFLILVDNALRYTRQGGTVSLGLRSEPPWAVVEVKDTGIGIRQEDLPRIFERFWRADAARSRDGGGTGLGLAIAKWIVDRQGGELLVTSTPGVGSCFAVRLPLIR